MDYKVTSVVYKLKCAEDFDSFLTKFIKNHPVAKPVPVETSFRLLVANGQTINDALRDSSLELLAEVKNREMVSINLTVDSKDGMDTVFIALSNSDKEPRISVPVFQLHVENPAGNKVFTEFRRNFKKFVEVSGRSDIWSLELKDKTENQASLEGLGTDYDGVEWMSGDYELTSTAIPYSEVAHVIHGALNPLPVACFSTSTRYRYEAFSSEIERINNTTSKPVRIVNIDLEEDPDDGIINVVLVFDNGLRFNAGLLSPFASGFNMSEAKKIIMESLTEAIKSHGADDASWVLQFSPIKPIYLEKGIEDRK